MLRKVTSVVKLMEWTTYGTTKVKVLSHEINNIVKVETVLKVEDRMKNNAKTRYYSLYLDHRPYHVLRCNLRQLGRSIVFLTGMLEQVNKGKD
ncbi:MAG: hypothetical protein ACR5KX_06600 [Wolbachia sp.]